MTSTEEQSVRELSDIDLGLSERLLNPDFRREWFRAELEDSVPGQYRALRERRQITQTELARLIGTKQPSICRFEQSDEAKWEFEFLLRMAEALDARLRLVIEAAEDVLPEYDDLREGEASALSDCKPLEQQSNAPSALSELGSLNGPREHRGEPRGVPRLSESEQGRSVQLGHAQRGSQSLQLSALSGQSAASGIR